MESLLVLVVLTCLGIVRAQSYAVCSVPEASAVDQILNRLAVIEQQLESNNTERIVRLERNADVTKRDIARFSDTTGALRGMMESIEERVNTMIINLTVSLARERAINDPDWFTISSSDDFQFRVTTSRQTWLKSVQACQDLGGELASKGIKNNGVRRKIAAALKIENTWIGLNDRYTEGEWRWLDQSVATPQNTQWFSGEPSNSGGNQDCGEIWGERFNYRLNDDYCNKRQAALCERRL